MDKNLQENDNKKTNRKINLAQMKLSDDALFSLLMQYEDFCKKVLSIILDTEIVEIKYKQVQKSFQNLPGYKSIRLDVYALDINNVLYNVEMQKRDIGHIPKRSRYYQGTLDVSSLLSGVDVDYSQLLKTYIIFITDFDLFGKGLYQYTFTNQCHESPGLELGDESIKMFLNMKGKIKGDTSDTIVDFLNYLDNTMECSKEVDGNLLDLHNIVKKLVGSKEVEDTYMNMQWIQHEAEAIGIEQGKEIGIEEGKEIGIESNRVGQIRVKLSKGYNEKIMEEHLELEPSYIKKVITLLENNPDSTDSEIAFMLKQ